MQVDEDTNKDASIDTALQDCEWCTVDHQAVFNFLNLPKDHGFGALVVPQAWGHDTDENGDAVETLHHSVVPLLLDSSHTAREAVDKVRSSLHAFFRSDTLHQTMANRSSSDVPNIECGSDEGVRRSTESRTILLNKALHQYIRNEGLGDTVIKSVRFVNPYVWHTIASKCRKSDTRVCGCTIGNVGDGEVTSHPDTDGFEGAEVGNAPRDVVEAALILVSSMGTRLEADQSA